MRLYAATRLDATRHPCNPELRRAAPIDLVEFNRQSRGTASSNGWCGCQTPVNMDRHRAPTVGTNQGIATRIVRTPPYVITLLLAGEESYIEFQLNIVNGHIVERTSTGARPTSNYAICLARTEYRPSAVAEAGVN